MQIDNFLEHYGKKGMKWGVRKSRTQKENKIRNKRQKLSDKRRQLSDKDLKSYIERLGNEKKLKELVDNDLHPGKSVAKKIMSESGQKVARTVVTGAALYGLKIAVENKGKAKGLSKAFNPKEAADFLIRGGVKKK